MLRLSPTVWRQHGDGQLLTLLLYEDISKEHLLHGPTSGGLCATPLSKPPELGGPSSVGETKQPGRMEKHFGCCSKAPNLNLGARNPSVFSVHSLPNSSSHMGSWRQSLITAAIRKRCTHHISVPTLACPRLWAGQLYHEHTFLGTGLASSFQLWQVAQGGFWGYQQGSVAITSSLMSPLAVTPIW